MPLPSDRYAAEGGREASKWFDAATTEDVEWMDEWYRANGRKGLHAQLEERRTEVLDLLREGLPSALLALDRLQTDERRLCLLCCLRAAEIGAYLLQEISTCALDGGLTPSWRLGQAAQVVFDLDDLLLNPWPFAEDPFGRDHDDLDPSNDH